MSRRARRILFTSLVLLVAAVIVWLAFTGRSRKGGPNLTAQNAASKAPATSPQATGAAPKETASPPDVEAPANPDGAAQNANGQNSTQAASTPATPMQGLRAVPAEGGAAEDQPPRTLGSLDPRASMMMVEFARRGGSIARIHFTDIWQTAAAKRQADRYRKQLSPGVPYDPTQVDESQRYVMGNLARAQFVFVNGQRIDLQGEDVWTETGPGTFITHIVDADNQPLLQITRQFTLGPTYDITLNQTFRNLSSQKLEVRWQQFGPTDLDEDTSGYIERRRFDFGYLPDPVRQPDLVLTGEFEHTRADMLSINNKALEATTPEARRAIRTIWPNATSTSRNYQLSWFASMSRYFSVAVHPTEATVAGGMHSLKPSVEEITFDVANTGHDAIVFTTLHSPLVSIEPGQTAALNLGLYAGPLDRHVLSNEPFAALAMREMILYSMGGCCTFMTFQWLAKLMLGFLSFLHDSVVFDWGIAIILLVLLVRTLLHPLTKKSQINMQKFGRQMQSMKPELDKLQKKYAGDKKRLQIEQMKLMREHNLSPLQAVGCLPIFLQMPIWIALWAMLYLAFDIRHQPAFYGVFQAFGDWQFLGDLSSPDHFWLLPAGGFVIPLINVRIDALNILPLLMGVVFFIQQKYMSPPPSPNMTPEQMQQQKIMKVMMVVMMPLFLYKAPSGLTLYIFTSTCIGIMESKYIRAHIDELLKEQGGEGNGTGVPRDRGPKKPKGTLGRMWAEKLEAARAKAAAKSAEPPKSFKKRR